MAHTVAGWALGSNPGKGEEFILTKINDSLGDTILVNVYEY